MGNIKLSLAYVLLILLINCACAQRRSHIGHNNGRRGNTPQHRRNQNRHQHSGAFAVMLLNGKGPSIGVVRIESMVSSFFFTLFF